MLKVITDLDVHTTEEVNLEDQLSAEQLRQIYIFVKAFLGICNTYTRFTITYYFPKIAG